MRSVLSDEKKLAIAALSQTLGEAGGCASAPFEAMVQAERQAIFADWIAQLGDDDSPEAAAMVCDVAARPTHTSEAFRDWLVTSPNRDIEEEVGQARRIPDVPCDRLSGFTQASRDKHKTPALPGAGWLTRH